MSQEDVDYLSVAHQYNPDKKMPVIYALTSKSIGIDPAVCRYELNYKLGWEKHSGSDRKCGRRRGGDGAAQNTADHHGK